VEESEAVAAKKRRRKRKKPKRKKCPSARRYRKLSAKQRKRLPKRCRPKKKVKRPLKPNVTGTHPAATLPTPPSPGTPAPVPPPAPPASQIDSPIGVYTGAFGRAQAERLLWRAGFGPRPGQADELAALGLEGAVLSLTRPSGAAPMHGPDPVVNGGPLDPYNVYNHDHLYWLDRMVRSGHQLVERLALVFHDWWATSNQAVGSNKLMLDQTNVFRAHGLGSFRQMVVDMTRDPAMLLFLNGTSNRRNAINENYGRELMELFTLGADRGAYTETDVRELARALSGWRGDWTAELGWHNFRFDPNRWDNRNKTVFGHTGNFTWEDACRHVVEHSLHPSFFVTKLWSYFIPTAPSAEVVEKLSARYVATGYAIRPIVEAILCSPEFHAGPSMVKPPVVLVAGMLRALGRGIDRNHWDWVCAAAGQRLYEPPDVAGWDDRRWLDTYTLRGRWEAVTYCLEGRTVPPAQFGSYPAESADQAFDTARAVWGTPRLSDETTGSLRGWAGGAIAGNASASLRAQRQNALRQLVAASPDYQTA